MSENKKTKDKSQWQKAEVCEVIAFVGIMLMFIAGFSAWIFGAAADAVVKPMGVIGLAAFLLGAWKGGVFRG